MPMLSAVSGTILASRAAQSRDSRRWMRCSSAFSRQENSIELPRPAIEVTNLKVAAPSSSRRARCASCTSAAATPRLAK